MTDDYMEIQRRNFEKQFGNLEDLGFKDKSKQDQESSEDNSDDSDNSGFNGFDEDEETNNRISLSGSEEESLSEDSVEASDEEEVVKPRVVKLGADDQVPVQISKEDQKMLRKGRAPTLAELEKKRKEQEKLTRKQQAAMAKEDSENLENDLKLQRLLKESHILAHNVESSGADLTLQTLDYEAPIGNARRRILDERIRAVSATNSSTGGLPKKLEKMPMNLRKGIISARERRAAEHEKEAREAGIVLSKVKKGQLRDIEQGKGVTSSSDRLGVGKKQKKRVRDRGLKINSIGKSTRNGLRISASEIERISNMGKKRRK